MAERFREWTVDTVEIEPVRFILNDVKLEALPNAPFGMLADFMADNVNGVVKYDRLQKFLRDLLVDETNRARYDEVTHDIDRPIHAETIQEIVHWLFDLYTVRPTPPAAGSSSGPEITTDSSADISPEPDDTPEP